jgi:hypothetical protein
MMAYISKTDPPNFLADSIYSYPMHIFVFKRINDFKRINERWELEKARERFSKIEADEEQLIADLLHKEKLGIEEIQLPLEEEREIHSIIEREYKSKVIEDYKKISPQLPKDLKISKVEFSQPRKYRDLEDRIGIISYISETEPPGYGKGQEWEIFILKKTNNKWAIERKIVGSHDFYKDEENLIQEMKAGLL